MPPPKSDREVWEEELSELLTLIGAHQRDLNVTPLVNLARREMLQRQIRREELRIAELRKRLADLPPETRLS